MTDTENEIRGAHETAVARLQQIRASIDAMREQERQIYLRIKDCEAAGRIFDIAFNPIDRPATKPDGVANVREFTMGRLLAAPNGIRSPAILAAYKETFGRELHPKTIGMTLYRLKQDGLAARQGRVWYSCDAVGSAPDQNR